MCSYHEKLEYFFSKKYAMKFFFEQNQQNINNLTFSMNYALRSVREKKTRCKRIVYTCSHTYIVSYIKAEYVKMHRINTGY